MPGSLTVCSCALQQARGPVTAKALLPGTCSKGRLLGLIQDRQNQNLHFNKGLLESHARGPGGGPVTSTWDVIKDSRTNPITVPPIRAKEEIRNSKKYTVTGNRNYSGCSKLKRICYWKLGVYSAFGRAQAWVTSDHCLSLT